MQKSLLNFQLAPALCKSSSQSEKTKTKFKGRPFLLMLSLLILSISMNAQTISTSISTGGTTTVLSGQTYTVELGYSVSNTTGSVSGMQAIIDLPDNIFGIANFVGTTHAPIANFVYSNVGGDKQLIINFISPLPSGSSGFLRFDIITQNLTTPDGTLLTTTAYIQASTGLPSATVTSNVTVNAAPSLCARKTLLSGGAVGYPTTYRIALSATGDYNYNNIKYGTLQSTGITITDVLPAGATFVSAKIYRSTGFYFGDATYSAGTITAAIPDNTAQRNTQNSSTGWVDINSYLDITVQYNNPPFSAGDIVTNTATVQFTPLGGTATTLENGTTFGTCTSDLIETITLAAPVVSATISKAATAGTVYPGQQFFYYLGFNNTGNVPLEGLEIIEDIPSHLRIDTTAAYKGVRIDAAAWAYLDHLEYQTTVTATWVAMSSYPTVPYNLPTVPPDGGYITKIKYVFKPSFPANTVWPSYTLIHFTAIDVATPTVVTNCIRWSTTATREEVTKPGEVNRSACSDVTVNPRPVTSKINYSSTANNPCAGVIGTQTTYSGTVVADIGYSDATNPICAFLIPSGMEYVPGSEIFTVGTSGITTAPTLEIIKNYATMGSVMKDLYRWTFPAGTVLPYGTTFTVSVKTVATNTLIPGVAYNADFFATASNSSVNTANSFGYGTLIDTKDWDMDGISPETFASASTNYGHCNLIISPAANLESTKWVKGLLDADYVKYPAIATTVAGGNADYKLVVYNPGNVVMKNITIIDILPHVGDRGVIDPTFRESEWRPNLAGPIEAPAGITVYYSTVANPCRDEVKSPSDASPYPTGCVAPNWSITPPMDLTKVQAIKIDFGAITLAGGESLEFSWPMRAPLNVLPDEIAWNSFAFTATRSDNNVPLISAEPDKVGIEILTGSPGIFGDKVWHDTNHNGIQDAGEAGVDGVIVNLYTPTDAGVRNPETDQLIAFTITGNGGEYLFSNLPTGNYYAVFIIPAGYNVSPANASGSTAENNSDGTAFTFNGSTATMTPITNILSTETDRSWDQGIYLYTISGNVFNDKNGLTNPDLTVNGTPIDGTNTGTGTGIVTGQEIYAHLLDNNGAVIATTLVSTSGTYSFSQLYSGNYSVVINNSSTPSTATTLPTGWLNTGENIGAGAGNDGNINGKSATIILEATDVTNVNFGIEQPPAAPNQNYVIASPQLNAYITLNGDGTVNSPGPLKGSDFEDGTLGSGNTFTITDLDGLNGNTLWYAGNPITGPITITNYNPALLQVQLTGVGSSQLSFEYTVTDAAGVQSPAATYTISWIAGGPLPVKLTGFAARLKDCNSLLSWVTASEENFSHFEIQQSTNAVSFKTVGRVDSKNIATGSSYQFTAANETAGINYYRLLMVDINGDKEYSQIIQVNGCISSSMRAYPNPARDHIQVEFKGTNKACNYELTDMAGRILQTGVLQANTTNTISIKGAASGTYVLKVWVDGELQTKQIQIFQ